MEQKEIKLTLGFETKSAKARVGLGEATVVEKNFGVIYMNGVEIYKKEIYDMTGDKAETYVLEGFAKSIEPYRETILR